MLFLFYDDLVNQGSKPQRRHWEYKSIDVHWSNDKCWFCRVTAWIFYMVRL